MRRNDSVSLLSYYFVLVSVGFGVLCFCLARFIRIMTRFDSTEIHDIFKWGPALCASVNLMAILW